MNPIYIDLVAKAKELLPDYGWKEMESPTEASIEFYNGHERFMIIWRIKK